MRAGVLCVRLLLLAVCWRGVVSAAPSDIPATPTAASLADPARWKFVGCEAFPADELRDALAANLDVIVASRSSATIDNLIEVVTRELKLGYDSVGHPDAVVTADVDQDPRLLVITIEEGKLYRQGKVEVRGAVSLDEDRLIAAITQKYAPVDAIPVFSASPAEGEAPLRWLKANGEPEKLHDAIWISGKSASFDSATWKAAESIVQLMMKREGFADSVVKVSVERAEDGTATMVVTIQDEGPRIVLGNIKIVGNERNPSEDILEYLQLCSGQPFNAMRQAQVHWQLRQSARFLKHEVQLNSPPIGDGPSQLKLTVVEAPGVPTLKEAFPAEQQVAMRAAQWMSTQREFDWQISLNSTLLEKDAGPFWEQFIGNKFGLRYIVSPVERGTQVELKMSNREDRFLWGQVLSVARDAGWLLAPHRQSKFEWGPLHGTLVLQISADAHPPNEHGSTSRLNFGFGFNSNEAKDGQPIREAISIAPLPVILLVTKETNKVELTDERMTVRGEGFELEIDSKSGRFLSFKLEYAESQLEIRTDKGLLAAAQKEWQPIRNAARNQSATAAPLTMALKYVAEEARAIEKLQSLPLPKWFRLAERIVHSGVLRPLDEAIAKSSEKTTQPDPFSIPVQPNPKSPLGALAWLDPVIRAGLPHYAKVFPRETPGWTIGRELALLLLQPKGVEIPSPIGVSLMLTANNAGPLHYLLAAQLFGIVSPAHRFILANGGLEVLTADSFRHDVTSLLSERGIGADSAKVFAELLRSLDESDLEDLTELLTPSEEDKALVSALLKELSHRRDEPAAVVLPDLAERSWPIVRPHLEAALRELAASPTAPVQPPVRVTSQPDRRPASSESPLSRPLPPLPPAPSSFKPIPNEPFVPTISPKVPVAKPIGDDLP